VALVVYLGFVVLRESRAGAEEVFPFASWSLFSLVPNQVEDFSLRVTRLNGKPLEPPKYFEALYKVLPSVSDHSARMTIQKLGRALAAGKGEDAKFWRDHLEQSYLAKFADVDYQVVHRRYDVMDRWRQNRIDDETVMASYCARRK
jgi:hypothetical protein